MSNKRLCSEAFGIPKIHIVKKTRKETVFFAKEKTSKDLQKQKRQKVVDKYKGGSIFTCPKCKSNKDIEYRDKFCRSSDEGARTTVQCNAPDCGHTFDVG